MGQRAAASATISFGLISVPVKFYLSASNESFSFNIITQDGNRVKQKLVDSVTGTDVDKETCNKGYAYTKDQYIVFTDEELKALEGPNQNQVELTEFIDDTNFSPIMVEKAYYVGPDKGAERSYRLLTETLAQMGKVAVARWYSRGKDHLVTLVPTEGSPSGPGDAGSHYLTMFQLFFPSEIRPFEYSFSQATEPQPNEIELAKKLVGMMSSDQFDPTRYSDQYAERLREAIETKRSAGPAQVGQNVSPVNQAPAFDLAAMLQASLGAQVTQTKRADVACRGQVRAELKVMAEQATAATAPEKKSRKKPAKE